MNRLFSYCIPVDDGAAPNPYGGYCTLVICKPRIRSVAQVGDWVVGTGSVHAPVIGDASGKVVYAMEVTEVKSIRDYDTWARENCPVKIPDARSPEVHRRLGDCLYDFSGGGEIPRMRKGVHGPANMEHDLGGHNALISGNFYYFGDKPQKLPEELMSIVKQGQGHKSYANQALLPAFVEWIESLPLAANELHGKPQYQIAEEYWHDQVGTVRCGCSQLDEIVEDHHGVC